MTVFWGVILFVVWIAAVLVMTAAAVGAAEDGQPFVAVAVGLLALTVFAGGIAAGVTAIGPEHFTDVCSEPPG